MIAIFRYCTNKLCYGIGVLLLIVAAGLGLLIPLQIKIVFNEMASNHLMLSRLLPLIGLFVLNILLTTIGNYILGFIGEQTVCRIRNCLINNLSHLELMISGGGEDEEIANHITNDTEIISDVLTTTLPTLVTGTLTWLGSIIMLFAIQAYLTSFILVCSLFLFLIIRYVGIRLKTISEKFRSQLAVLNASLVQLTKFSLDIKINDSGEWFIHRTLDKNQELYRLSLKGLKYRMILIPIINMVLLIMMITIIGLGIYSIKKELITIGALVSFMIYLYQLLPVTLNLATTLTNFSGQQGALSFVFNKLEQNNLSKTMRSTKSSTLLSPTAIFGENLALTIENKDIYRNISFTAKQGQVLVITGPSGSGKSSLLRQLLGFYPLTDGVLRFDNQNVALMPYQERLDQISFLGQQSFIFNGETLWDNLTLGDNFSLEEITHYLKEFQLWDELGCEEGLDQLKLDSECLSGGQIQRLSLIRILLRDRKIIILDEVTSALDAKNEERVIDILNAIKDRHIIIQVSHREQIIAQADSLITLGG
ncbi:ATP-binding cassette domain-containing protein [Streptococcus pluranimalium]|uniref:ATP-binding cassette domain-containing protein n=1 Tax=Streptococcus pluranimalium TaxID=82348 RepID=UPI0039FD680D